MSREKYTEQEIYALVEELENHKINWFNQLLPNPREVLCWRLGLHGYHKRSFSEIANIKQRSLSRIYDLYLHGVYKLLVIKKRSIYKDKYDRSRKP